MDDIRALHKACLLYAAAYMLAATESDGDDLTSAALAKIAQLGHTVVENANRQPPAINLN
jgi:hypothetical protein